MISFSPGQKATGASHAEAEPQDLRYRLVSDLENITLPTTTQDYIHISKYGKWRDEWNRRETWFETTQRLINFYADRVASRGQALSDEEYRFLFEKLARLETVPSMRALMTAGVAAEQDNAAVFNCSYAAVDHPQVFSEALYILACGSGFGFSVEHEAIDQLPTIPDHSGWIKGSTVVFDDSRIGWAEGYQRIVNGLFDGVLHSWDVSQIRPAGARLKTFGGRASGPGPLVELIEHTIKIFLQACGRKLKSTEIHSIMCKIGQAIVSGGVRRSAEISLSDLDDLEMQEAKTKDWWVSHPEFALANNSAIYYGRPEEDVFWAEWQSLVASNSGERGIFNRQAAEIQTQRNGRRTLYHFLGCNPCAEILLRRCQFCNLSEIIIRAFDTVETLKQKIAAAVAFGAIQASFTNFRYLRDIWKKNTEEECLLGVSLTGILDNVMMSSRLVGAKLSKVLQELRDYAVTVCAEWCDRLKINMSVAITTVKPSGTVSQLVNSASGIHPRYAQYYMRSYRENNVNPICQFMKDMGIPNEPDLMNPDKTTVFYFPVAAPEGCVTRHDMTAVDQLELWLAYKQHWSEHSVSCTVYVRPDEWERVGDWVYNHFDEITGISFLPFDNGSYQQAPYTEISKEEYEFSNARMPMVNWRNLRYYEEEDTTESAKNLACSSGACELA